MRMPKVSFVGRPDNVPSEHLVGRKNEWCLRVPLARLVLMREFCIKHPDGIQPPFIVVELFYKTDTILQQRIYSVNTNKNTAPMERYFCLYILTRSKIDKYY